MIQEFVLFEDEENVDTLHPYGDITTDRVGYRLVLLIKDNNVSFEYQSGVYRYNHIEWDECEPFDIDPKELDIYELDRLRNTITNKEGK